jgi:hypothetical protein
MKIVDKRRNNYAERGDLIGIFGDEKEFYRVTIALGIKQ